MNCGKLLTEHPEEPDHLQTDQRSGCFELLQDKQRLVTAYSSRVASGNIIDLQSVLRLEKEYMSNPPPPAGFETQHDSTDEGTALDPAFILQLTRELVPARHGSQSQSGQRRLPEVGQDEACPQQPVAEEGPDVQRQSPDITPQQEPDKQVSVQPHSKNNAWARHTVPV